MCGGFNSPKLLFGSYVGGGWVGGHGRKVMNRHSAVIMGPTDVSVRGCPRVTTPIPIEYPGRSESDQWDPQPILDCSIVSTSAKSH